jgi:hypothetical protein
VSRSADEWHVKLPIRLDWRRAATFVREDPEWRAKILRGGLLLLFPPIGWPAALGYRKALIARLTTRAEPLLPEWPDNTWRYWRDGMRALGVIFAHYAPIVVLYAYKLAIYGVPDLPWLGLAAFFGFFFFLTPFLLPSLIVASSAWAGGEAFSRVEVVLVFAYFAVATFMIPAGFLQVSRTGRYRDAFRFGDNVRFVARHFALYLEAWTFSSLIALVGHFCIPFSPWGVFWCYQSIVYSFNEIRMHTGDAEDAELAVGRSWFRVSEHEQQHDHGQERVERRARSAA